MLAILSSGVILPPMFTYYSEMMTIGPIWTCTCPKAQDTQRIAIERPLGQPAAAGIPQLR